MKKKQEVMEVKKTKLYQLDCRTFCGGVVVSDKEMILEIMPVLAKFKGQKLLALKRWAEKKFGYCRLEEVRKKEA